MLIPTRTRSLDVLRTSFREPYPHIHDWRPIKECGDAGILRLYRRLGMTTLTLRAALQRTRQRSMPFHSILAFLSRIETLRGDGLFHGSWNVVAGA